MKIGLVSPYDITWPGGVLAHISQLSRQFTLMGHEVKILGPCSASRERAEDGTYIPLGGSVPVPYGGSIARISVSPWILRQVREIIHREEFDIVHVHEPLAPLISLFALECSRSINVGTFHACYSNAGRYRFKHSLLKRWANRLHGRIAVSQGAYQQASGFFPGDYRIIPNGIDVDRFSGKSAPFPEFRDGKLNLLFVGRLEKRKGLRYLLEAFGELKWEFKDLRLIVVGPGELDAECWRVLSERNLQDVVFTGAVSGVDLPRYYSSADIFCAPATGRESFGVVLLEAMASGKPIVATQIQGYAAVVSHGQQGLLVPPADKDSLADAIARLLKDPQMRLDMGSAGRANVGIYRWDVVAQKVMDYYSSLIRGDNVSQ
jgi:phosphatidylinositol alpha-mannosyltransferase